MKAEKPAVALSRQEIAVLRLLAAGRTYALVAKELFVSVNTVKSHVSNIYVKLGVGTRAEAVQRARAQGVLPPNEESLRHQQERLEAILNDSRELITVIDAERRLVWANHAFRETLGRELDAHVGSPAAAFVHPDDRDRIARLFAEASQQEPGATMNFRCRYTHVDGTARWVEVHQVNRLDDPTIKGLLRYAHPIDGQEA
jgi:PAS domain S-box-containing protein